MALSVYSLGSLVIPEVILLNFPKGMPDLADSSFISQTMFFFTDL